MVPPAERQPAYVLHRRAFRETSAIVDLLTLDYGRVSGVVRGVKGGRRPRSHHIEPFAQVFASWRGRGQLVNVLRCEAATSRQLGGDALFAGLYLNELLVRMLSHEEPVAMLFAHYGEALQALAAGGDLEPTLRIFERRLLEELGYGLAFDVDVRSGVPIDGSKTYGVVVGEGFYEIHNGSMHQGDGAAPALVLSGSQIAAMSAGDYGDRTVRRAAKHVFRHALELRLGARRLATRSLFGVRHRSGRGRDSFESRVHG